VIFCFESSCKLQEAVQACTEIALPLPVLIEIPRNSWLFQGYGVLMIRTWAFTQNIFRQLLF